MARRIRIHATDFDQSVIEEAAFVIREGGLVILPTDTAYGLSGDPSNPGVVDRILTVKERRDKPGMPLLASNLEQVKAITILPRLAESLARDFWPGGLTLVVPTRLQFPEGILGPEKSLAVRIPNHPVTLGIIHRTGFPIIGTSANKSDMPSPRTADAAAAYVGHAVNLIIDAGPTYHPADSTIIDCTQKPLRILRVGAVSLETLQPYLKIS